MNYNLGKITFLALLVLLSTFSVTGQTSQNPFELKNRKSNLPTPEVLDSTNLSNTSNENEPTNPSIEPAKEEESIEEPEPIIETPPASPEIDTGTAGSVNPFEITSIPHETRNTPDFDSTKVSPAEDEGSGEEINAEEESILPSIISEDERSRLSNSWLALIFLIIFLLLVIVVNINRGLFSKIYRATINENFSGLLYRETKHSSLSYLYNIAYAIFFINAGLFIYLIQFVLNTSFSANLLISMVAILTIYLVRHIVLSVLSFVFPVSKEINQFNFNIIVFNIIIGLMLIPVNLFLAFGPSLLFKPIIFFLIGIVVILFLFRQFRGLLLTSHIASKNVFLFFIYLCAVEILPLAVLIKLFV